MSTRAYLFHGLNLTVAAAPSILEALAARLGGFGAGSVDRPSDLHFEYVRESGRRLGLARRPAGEGRPLLELGPYQALYFDEPPQVYLEVARHGRMVCDLERRWVTVCHPESEEAEPWLLAHVFFTVPLAEMLKRAGLYMVHAAGLALGGKGLLIAGASGCGKTTLALALTRAGFGFLGDDTVFLAARGELRALAFPDEVDITAQTAGFFPELRGRDHRGAGPSGQTGGTGFDRPVEGTAARGRPKQAICATRVYGCEPCWECAPVALVFPRPARAFRSELAPMPKDEALLQLVCNVLRTEACSSQAHLDSLAALVKGCRCYRLQTGQDFEALPPLLRPLLEQDAL